VAPLEPDIILFIYYKQATPTESTILFALAPEELPVYRKKFIGFGSVRCPLLKAISLA